MPVSVCPSAVVEAPVEDVWDLLANPERYEEWADVSLVGAEPGGPARVGQRLRFVTRALGRSFPVEMRVLEVDAQRRRIRLLVSLALGLVNDETVTLAPVGPRRTLVRFG